MKVNATALVILITVHASLCYHCDVASLNLQQYVEESGRGQLVVSGSNPQVHRYVGDRKCLQDVLDYYSIRVVNATPYQDQDRASFFVKIARNDPEKIAIIGMSWNKHQSWFDLDLKLCFGNQPNPLFGKDCANTIWFLEDTPAHYDAYGHMLPMTTSFNGGKINTTSMAEGVFSYCFASGNIFPTQLQLKQRKMLKKAWVDSVANKVSRDLRCSSSRSQLLDAARLLEDDLSKTIESLATKGKECGFQRIEISAQSPLDPSKWSCVDSSGLYIFLQIYVAITGVAIPALLWLSRIYKARDVRERMEAGIRRLLREIHEARSTLIRNDAAPEVQIQLLEMYGSAEALIPQRHDKWAVLKKIISDVLTGSFFLKYYTLMLWPALGFVLLLAYILSTIWNDVWDSIQAANPFMSKSNLLLNVFVDAWYKAFFMSLQYIRNVVWQTLFGYFY